MFTLHRCSSRSQTSAKPPVRANSAVPIAVVLLTLASFVGIPRADAGGTGDVVAALARDVREARIAMAVHLAMLDKFGADGLHVDVDVTGDTVTLTGEVGKRSTMELSEEVALSVQGVKKVDNRLRLKPATAAREKPAARALDKTEHEVSDAVLETRVKMKLLDQIGGNAFRIEVEATDGVVALRGTLTSSDTRDVALKTAGGTSGVTRVIDLLKVRE